ncbi:histidine kinase G7 [Pyricularia oryzae Y34]|uniref:Histidine kinase G7 n=2 Tax=Pyricularia oryzae TaxID=318829 RepID=A0AA97P6J1_PYRO3|nr:histidine kinase G7 [Pyricularia oryzae Y34]
MGKALRPMRPTGLSKAVAVYNDLDNLIPPAELRGSADPALTTFAELAVLRLKTSRALISLFDRNYQYIVAEATPSLPLAPYAKIKNHEAGEHLVLCGTAIPRVAGICELALGVPGSLACNGSTDDADIPVTIIPDLAADPRSSQRAFCHLAPENRFYTGVPLRTPKGIEIGVFCVFDTRPREDLDDVSIQFLRDLSQVIVDYLDFKRQRENNRRADRMIRGVGSFVEGESTIPERGTAEGPGAFDDHSAQKGVVGKVQQQQQQQHAKRDLDLELTEASKNCQSPSQAPPLRRPGPSPISNPNSSSNIGRSISGFAQTQSHLQEPGTRRIFSKATDLIREVIDVDSVLFLEASIRSFGGLAEPKAYAARPVQDNVSSSSSNDERDYHQRNGIGIRSQRSEQHTCRVLGFSSIDGGSPSQACSSVSERFLVRLLRRYPQGKIFNFDTKYKILSGDNSSGETISGLAAVESSEAWTATENGLGHRPEPCRKRHKKRISRLNEAKNIAAIFPEARSVAIVPLWDTQKHRWYAGGFICSTTPGRTFAVEHELSYLRTFGIVIMSEVDRLKAQLMETSKIDFLSSLSHELRSPLHGIILGAELLSDTPLDAFQGEKLALIETCSRTLLETINHLLDLSKINNFLGNASSRRQATRDARVPSGVRGFNSRGAGDCEKLGIEAGMMTIASDFELDVLTEEVIESVCAGFSHQRLSTEGVEDQNMIRKPDGIESIQDATLKSERHVGDVAVMFDINPAVSWTFHAQSGAIRRIIMNLLGNSLKFTSKGTVDVTVVQMLQDEGKAQNLTPVKIIVTDTGRGIGQEFLRHNLFSPFCQEDSLSSGLGLGLSLVNKIVATMGGSIQVVSKLGQGTKVTVVLPLRGAASSSPTGNLSSAGFEEFKALTGQLEGLQVALIGLPTEQNGHGGGGDSDWLQGTRGEGALLANFCTQWLRMRIFEGSTCAPLPADLIITTEACLENLLADQSHGSVSTPVVVVCQSPLVARQMATSARFNNGNSIFEFVSQPIGPRKLAKALLLSLRRRVKSQTSATSIATPSSPVTPKVTSGLTPRGSEIEDGTAQTFRQRIETVVQTATAVKVDSSVKESETQSSVIPQRPKEGSVSALGPADAPTKTAEKSDANGPRFLLVDDNPINLKILVSYAKKLGRRFACATNGLEAFEAFRESIGQGADAFKFVLTDISMPVMDGFESTRRMRSLEMERGLPRCNIFALTGLASAGAQEEAFASGIDLLLTKPVRLKELNKILESKGAFL